VQKTPPATYCDRPLIVRCGAFGDMVLLTELIRGLHHRFRSEVDILTSGPWSEPLLKGQPGVAQILCVRSRKTPYWLAPDQQRAVAGLRRRGAGPTWYCDDNDAAKGMLERAGIPSELVVDAKDHPRLPGEHVIEQWRRMAQILPTGIRNVTEELAARLAMGSELIVSEHQRADLDGWLQARRLQGTPLILVQVGNKRTMRRGLKRLAVNSKFWPIERWAAVLRQIHERCPRHALVLLGTGPEYALNQEVAGAADVAAIANVADDLPIPRLIALLSRADGLISVDSGPAHAAAAVACPQVVLFGKASPSLYRPWGTAGADVLVLCGQMNGEPDIQGISVQDVVAAWDSLRLRHRQ